MMGSPLYRNKKQSIVYTLYTVLAETPIIRRYFFKLRKKLMLLYPDDVYTINRMAVRVMLKSFLLIIPCIIAVCVFFDGEIFYMATSVTVIWIIFTNMLDTSISRLEYRLLCEFKNFLDDVRHYYYETGMLEDALFMAMDTVSHELGLHIGCFYKIVTSVEVFAEVEKYTRASPNRFFLTFVSNCASIKEYGDNKVDGKSVFLENLNYLKEAVNDELLQLDLVKALFAGLVFVCMLPMFFLKPLAQWGMSVFPEMDSFYEGVAGTVCMGIIYAVTIAVYEVIVSMQNKRMDGENGSIIADKILGNRFVKKLAVLHDDYNASRAERIGAMLRATGSVMGTQKFFVKRVLTALVMFVFINIIGLSSVHRTVARLLSDFSTAFTSAFITDESYRSVMEEVAAEYAYMHKNNTPDKALLADMLVMNEGMSIMYAEMIAEAVSVRISEAGEYKDYKWYFLCASVIGAVLGYYIPYIFLVFRNRRAFLEQQNELEQFQTIALILMNMSGITINTILEWLLRFSFCFREELERCILELEKSEEDALLRLRECDYKPFKHFSDCLLAIDKVGVRAAFAEIREERAYNKEKRRQDNKHMLERKAVLCKTIAFIPLYATVFGYLIIPFAITALNMFSEFKFLY